MFTRMQQQTSLFREMIEREGVDPAAAAREDHGGAFALAARRCLACPYGSACRDWLDSHRHEPAPDFCRNFAYLCRVSAFSKAPGP
ncbi:DUF6455 family protein [Bosea sp. (in: a-proteobacteria)]|uniref:DUF6455 family protein n=1 Tax=Bosea sp. (in: a-proteobacteria) TaxID=1871050 RepID=UPI00260C849C|nr:DUF6455 family protein [Bosea sp. (in: a-proteobacteria)]MCO5091183.1 DUF6455 family protein [Bosea sp. (in: a-proteobacteria)]